MEDIDHPIVRGERPDLELPHYLAEVLSAFWDLHTGRAVHMDGVCGISAADIAGWLQIHRHYDPPWFFRMIKAADEAYLGHVVDLREKRKKAAKKQPPSLG